MERAIAVDVGDGSIHIVNHSAGQDQLQVFGMPVLLGGRDGQRCVFPELFVTAQLHSQFRQFCGDARDERCSGVRVDQQGLQGIANAGSLGLGVDDDRFGLVEIGGTVDEDVTDAFVVLDHRDTGVLHNETDQALAAARDDQVDTLLLLEHLQHPLPLRKGDQRQGRFG